MTRFLTRAAEAYAAGNPRLGSRLFAGAYHEALPLVEKVVRRHLHDTRIDQEAAVQAAMTSMWKTVSRGTEPAIELHARNAAISAFRAGLKHESNDELDERLPARESTDEDSTATVVDLVAGYAPELWHDIADLAEAGWGQNEIALKLGKGESTLRRIATEIRSDYHLRRSIFAA